MVKPKLARRGPVRSAERTSQTAFHMPATALSMAQHWQSNADTTPRPRRLAHQGRARSAGRISQYAAAMHATASSTALCWRRNAATTQRPRRPARLRNARHACVRSVVGRLRGGISTPGTAPSTPRLPPPRRVMAEPKPARSGHARSAGRTSHTADSLPATVSSTAGRRPKRAGGVPRRRHPARQGCARSARQVSRSGIPLLDTASSTAQRRRHVAATASRPGRVAH